jgi:hypothetical protein
MSGRQVALIAVLAMIALLGFLTLSVMLREGLDPLVLVSFLILAMFGFGIVGALRHPPDE